MTHREGCSAMLETLDRRDREHCRLQVTSLKINVLSEEYTEKRLSVNSFRKDLDDSQT